MLDIIKFDAVTVKLFKTVGYFENIRVLILLILEKKSCQINKSMGINLSMVKFEPLKA